MTAHDWFIEHRTEYAAGTLSAAEMSAFAEHLTGCDACRAAVERIEMDLRWLPMGVSPVPPRPGLQRQILEHAVGRAPGRFRRWSLPIGIAASLLTGFTGWQLGRASSPDTIAPQVATAPASATAIDSRLLALQDTVSIMRQAARVMQARIMMHGQEGGMVIFDEPRTHRWNVVVHGLPAAPVDTGYQFWFICADGMVRGTRVSLDRTTPMLFTTGMPAPSCKVTGAALTMEPKQNADGPPQGKTLAHLML